ncbi:MAG TPA: hypothetical protein ENI61_00340 [Ignavibacteria bacterium]|nr:hypothetical protein [Ignavibacteria bacterium]
MNIEQKLFFTIDDIKRLATSSSFERGEDYSFSGEVNKIVRKGNLFEGTVYGSRKYKVSLNIFNNELNFKCNCPYDFGGICKHEVAFALEILNDKYIENTITEQSTILKEEFTGSFEKETTGKKLKFLKQLLNRDVNLQQQFIEFTKDAAENLDNIVGEKIDVVKNKIHNELSSLDFDNIEDNYEYNHYDNYWNEEGLYDFAAEMIQEVFSSYVNQAANYIKKGNLLDVIRITLGIYEGSQNLPELDNDDYCLFDGEYNTNVWDILKKSINNIALKIDEIVKSDETVIQIIDLTFERIKIYDAENNDDDENRIFYNIKDFEKLFQSLVINKTTAIYLLKQIQNNKFEIYEASYIILNLAEILNDETLWIKTAETFSKNDEKIAGKLIEKYKSKENKKDFIRTAKMAFHNWPNNFDLYLINNLDKAKQENLYVDALRNYVRNKHKIKYYEILRHYLTDNEKVGFVNDFKNDYNNVFYVQLLETEKRYKEILDCAERNKNSYDFDKLITPILNVYPSECFTYIINKNNETLNSYGRNRKTYQSMIKTLRLLKQIISKKEESVLFLNKLYNHKPNLPALKDEMRKANLVTNR